MKAVPIHKSLQGKYKNIPEEYDLEEVKDKQPWEDSLPPYLSPQTKKQLVFIISTLLKEKDEEIKTLQMWLMVSDEIVDKKSKLLKEQREQNEKDFMERIRWQIADSEIIALSEFEIKIRKQMTDQFLSLIPEEKEKATDAFEIGFNEAIRQTRNKL